MNTSSVRHQQHVWMHIGKLSFYTIAFSLLVGCQPFLLEPVQPIANMVSNSSIGQLAYIGEDGNVYVVEYSAAGEQLSRREVTNDSTILSEGTGRSHHRLSWSPGGSLAFARVECTPTGQRGELYAR